MRLKSLKLSGFKSFANPTTFYFKHNITAIVGPNGCGKSNVIDAMRWVLGETRAKQLRGSAMSDVIFGGVEGRAGKSMASVELTFEHTQDEKTGIRHALNLYHELTLRRQVHKDGKSEYFINGERVRRRDVVDVFLGTGLGARSYAVIEQGMIGRIVESSPLELREFIEEAAGVSRYQARRAETQAQLIATGENLARLSDLQSELFKQQKTLQKQAKSAHQYQALQDELIALNKQSILQKLFTTWQVLNKSENEYKNIDTQKLNLQNELQDIKDSLAKHHAKLQTNLNQKDSLKSQYHQAQLAEQTATHELSSLQNELERLDGELTKLLENQQTHSDNTRTTQADLANMEQELATLAPQMTDIEHKLTKAQNALQTNQAQSQNLRQSLGKLNAQKHSHTNAKALAQSHKTRLQNSLNKWANKYNELTKQGEKLASEQGMAEDLQQLENLSSQINELQSQLTALPADDKTAITTAKAELHTKQSELQKLEQRQAVLYSEQTTLTALITPKADDVDKSNSSDDYADTDTLQSLIRLSEQGEQYADVLDKFLGFWLSAGVLSVDSLPSIPTHSPQGQAVSAILTACTSKEKQVSDLPSNLLPLDTLIATPRLDLWQGVYLWTGIGELPRLDRGVILAPTGWLFGAFGAVHIDRLGADSAFLSGQLASRQRLDEISRELNKLSPQLITLKKEVSQAKETLEQLEHAQDTQQKQRQTLNEQIYKIKEQHNKLSAKVEKDRLTLDNYDKSLTELQIQKQEWEQELSQIEKDLADHDKNLNDVLTPLEHAQKSLKTFTDESNHLNSEINALTKEKQALAIKYTALTQNLTHAKQTLANSQKAEQDIKQTLIKLNQDKANLSADLPHKHQALDKAKQSAKQLNTQYDELDKTWQDLNDKTNVLNEKHHTAQDSLTALENKIQQLGADRAVSQSRLQDLAGQMTALESGFVLADTLQGFIASPPTFGDLTAQTAKAQTALTRLGAVNLAAAVELAELNERINPLQTQIDDIMASMDTLESAMNAIDEQTKTLFLDMLGAVNATLSTLFAKVFGGGVASLSLIDDDSLSKADKWRAGLELMAQPKGKKNARLAVLSGGEKTLTALSLIFAIFKQHPAPFCVLDEVDAPLDDANVGRFTALIDELSQDVQFIFISHNKLSMQIADELKGITMPTAGVSSLVTVSLGEAEQYLN